MKCLEGVGIYLKYKLDEKFFRRSTRDAQQVLLTECQFADDAAIRSTTRQGAEQAIMTYIDVANKLGLTMNLQKTKSGYGVEEDDRAPIDVGESAIVCVEEFPYLGSVVMSSGRIDAEVDRRIANASRAFGALHRASSRMVTLPLPPSVRCTRRAYYLCSCMGLSAGLPCTNI